MLNLPISTDDPVLVIGASGVDIVGRIQSELHHGTSNPAHIRSSFGGVARNVAENLARLGHPVTLITAIGADQIGQQMVKYTRDCGVDVQGVVCSPDWPTGTYLAMINNTGQLQFALDDMRAISGLSPQHIRQHYDLFKQAALLFIDANLPPKTLRTTLSLARRARLTVCADPTSTTLAERLKPYLDRLHILTANSNEAAILTGQPFDPTNHEQSLETARKLVSLGVEFAIVTMAEFGLSYATSEHSGHIPALQTEIIDPTGAGDAMIAAILFALLNDIPPDEAVRIGVAAASLTLRHQGAVVPDLSLEKLYNHLVI